MSLFGLSFRIASRSTATSVTSGIAKTIATCIQDSLLESSLESQSEMHCYFSKSLESFQNIAERLIILGAFIHHSELPVPKVIPHLYHTLCPLSPRRVALFYSALPKSRQGTPFSSAEIGRVKWTFNRPVLLIYWRHGHCGTHNWFLWRRNWFLPCVWISKALRKSSVRNLTFRCSVESIQLQGGS